MPPEITKTVDWLVQAGAVGALALLLWAVKSGWIRTEQEVDNLKAACRLEVEAWKARAERAEEQVDRVLPAVERLTAAILGRKWEGEP